MKILNEAKENLPVSFLTDFISKGWEEVGYLKADIEAIKTNFKGTKPIEELIQSLIDAYLVCIGQLEAHIQDKNYIDYPEESGLAQIKTESLTEEINVNIDKVEMDVEVTVNDMKDLDELQDLKQEKVKETSINTKFKDNDSTDTFEYFVDFDEPDMTQPKLKDSDLYNEE